MNIDWWPSPRNTRSAGLRNVLLCWQRATHRQRKARDPCVYKGLCQVESSHLRNTIVSLRLAGLALFIITNGLPMTVFPCFINWLDTWFPGEAGETNHSKAFIERFRQSAVKTLRMFQKWDLDSILPALQLRSDICVISDGISTSSGIPLHCHIVLQEARGGGGLQYNLLGAQPVTAVADSGLVSSSCLKFATKEALLQHSAQILEQFGLQYEERRKRWSGRIGDGLEEGPRGQQLGSAEASSLGIEHPDLYGNLDVWHSVETAASHADALCGLGGIKYQEQYLAAAKRMRSRFSFGAQQALPKAR